MSMEKLYMRETKGLYDVHTRKAGPRGRLPLTDEVLRTAPSGNIFGMTINAGMGWNPDDLAGGDVLIISTQGGIRRDDGTTGRRRRSGCTTGTSNSAISCVPPAMN